MFSEKDQGGREGGRVRECEREREWQKREYGIL